MIKIQFSVMEITIEIKTTTTAVIKHSLNIIGVQHILCIPLKVKLQALEYRRRWWNLLLDKQLGLGYWEKLMIECILSKSAAW